MQTTGGARRASLSIEDVERWLRDNGWEMRGSLSGVASLWQLGDEEVLLPLTEEAPDFPLRWREMFDTLSRLAETSPSNLKFQMSRANIDVAELVAHAEGTMEGAIPLADGEALISSTRQAIVAAANATLQRRAYFGHSIPKLAREHARFVQMGLTRTGSYVIPIISRIPDPSLTSDEEESVLFEMGEVPFERRVMIQLARAVQAINEMAVASGHEPSRKELNESVGVGVSHELCDALAKAIRRESVSAVGLAFSWARQPSRRFADREVTFPKETGAIIRRMAEHLRGSEVVADQNVRGFVIGLSRDEEEQYGRVTLRVGTGKQRHRVKMSLDQDQYALAIHANSQRMPVSVTGRLTRDPGRAWSMDVRHFEIPERTLEGYVIL